MATAGQLVSASWNSPPSFGGTVIGHRRRPTTHGPPTRSPEPLDAANDSVLREKAA